MTWSVSSGSLPSGLTLTRDGSLYGTPTEIGESGFQIQAKYKTKAAVGSYQIDILKSEKWILAAAGTRTWEDGMIAATCKEYMSPTWPYTYEGDTGDGVYKIKPADAADAFDVYCDMTTDGGGWTTIQRRFDGSVNFYRGWAEYVTGFGSISGEHWLGLENIQKLTASPKELRFDLGRHTGERGYAKYTNFALGSSEANYTVSGAYSGGSAGDSFSYHIGLPFSTYDADHDANIGNCAQTYKGAWWYGSCHYSNLNGPWHDNPYQDHPGIEAGVVWRTWTGKYEPLVLSEMKVR